MNIATCIGCGKQYTKRHNSQYYCTPACRINYNTKYIPREPQKRICEGCKKEFMGWKNQKYCTTGCRLLQVRSVKYGVEACKVCGKVFRKPEDLEKGICAACRCESTKYGRDSHHLERILNKGIKKHTGEDGVYHPYFCTGCGLHLKPHPEWDYCPTCGRKC